MDPSIHPESGRRADPPEAAWRRWRSRFYLGLLAAMMAAIALAGWWNLRRLAER